MDMNKQIEKIVSQLVFLFPFDPKATLVRESESSANVPKCGVIH